jgi:hypothetical protein
MSSLRAMLRKIGPLRSFVRKVRIRNEIRAAAQAPQVVQFDKAGPVLKEADLPPVDLTLIGKPIRLYVVGDSHCLPLRDLIVGDEFTGREYLVVSKYIQGLTASAMVRDGDIAPAIMEALESESLIRDGRFTFSSRDSHDLAVGYAAGIPGSPPLIVISAGDIDLRASFLPKLADQYDLVLPFEVPYGLRKEAKIMPYNVARRMATDAFQPMAEAIRKLKAMGLTRIFVMTIVPPTMNQERFDAMHGFVCPLDTRYKAAVLFNRVLAESCTQAGATVVDIWPDVLDQRGYLRPEFELDSVHLNRRASMLTIQRIIGAGIGKHGSVSSTRYRLAHSLIDKTNLDPTSPEIEALARTFHETSICRTEIDASIADSIADRLDFNLDVGNRHARLDWDGNTVAPFSDLLRAAEPSQEVLDILHGALYAPPIASLMQACMGGDVWYLNARPFQSLPHDGSGAGPQDYHHDGNPPHIIRAIIYLVDVDEDNGPFEYVDGNDHKHRVTGPKGTMFIFDANRLLHRAVPPRGRLRKSVDFVILPRTKSQPRSIIWAGINNWPGDPFHFSVNKMRASPPVTGKILETNPLTG